MRRAISSSSEQITAMKTELDPGISREELLAEFHEGLDRAAGGSALSREPIWSSRGESARSSFPPAWEGCLCISPIIRSGTPGKS